MSSTAGALRSAVMGALLMVAQLSPVTGAVEALAAEALPAEAPVSFDQLRARLQQVFPQTRIERVVPAPWPGMYEVQGETDLAYISADGKRMFTGHVIDLEQGVDLSAARWSALHAIDYRSLPFDQAIMIVHGKGTREVVVFADPLCPFCRQLEQQLQDFADVRVQLFLFPLERVHPGATARARSIWCARDRAAAWTDWMLKQAEPQAADKCDDSALAAIESVGRSLGINSTPTLFFTDGHRLPGVASSERLEQEFAQAAHAVVAHSSDTRMPAATRATIAANSPQ